MGSRPIKVLVVDDSAFVRRFATGLLAKDPEIEVVGAAVDPFEARDLILKKAPDVVTLDIEMPKMDGLTFLRILMRHHPIPVVIMSSLSQAGSAIALEALQAGAVEVIAKPYGSNSVSLAGRQLIDKVKAAAQSRVRRISSTARKPVAFEGTEGADPRRLILLGASTGGTEALKNILQRLPATLPGIAIVQHIPAHFSRAFAERLNSLCAMEVREACDGDLLRPGLALVAAGDFHMILHRGANGFRVSLRQGPAVWHQRPAVDVLFKSALDCGATRSTAALLTGMGRDGAEGLLRLREAGFHTIAQDEETSVVYGMPKAAADLGAAAEILPLDQIPLALVRSLSRPLATA
ncbi:MAG: chemotaxis response regulator protein-glutamate methylesterase [Puniceicoccaceae bacterium]|nr:MAG: chemotaxis response regulator protein-glutamate methylesterase [Puniceicoccaceae bacterium]